MKHISQSECCPFSLPFNFVMHLAQHNKLCCAKCITQLKDKNYGQHSDCEICFLKDIENDKKYKLKENIKCLEDISAVLEQKINELKIIFEKIDKNKEELKTNYFIQKGLKYIY